MSNFFRFVIMGPPGSGKGTISKRIVQNFNLAYLASGDILRNQIREKTSKGNEAKVFIENGELVPDDLITSLVLEHLKTLSTSNWLLDGFPRTVKQADDLTSKYSLTLAINLIVPHEVIIDRLKGRWVHTTSGRIYNTGFSPPKIDGKDDETGEDLVQREDDKPHIVSARLAGYEHLNAPVADYFRKKNILKEFAGKETNEIWPKIKLYLNEVLN